MVPPSAYPLQQPQAESSQSGLTTDPLHSEWFGYAARESSVVVQDCTKMLLVDHPRRRVVLKPRSRTKPRPCEHTSEWLVQHLSKNRQETILTEEHIRSRGYIKGVVYRSLVE